MIKPISCEKCGNEPEGSVGRVSNTRFINELICWGNKDGGLHSYAQARTRLGAILRWNWRQRRARRKSKMIVEQP